MAQHTLYGFFKSTKSGKKAFVTDWLCNAEHVNVGDTLEAFDDEDLDLSLGQFKVESIGEPFKRGGKGKPFVYLYTGDKSQAKVQEDTHGDFDNDSGVVFAR